jgi:type I restriction enzyme S subunit
MAKLKPYGEYRETGLLWLGKAPKHWNSIRGKEMFVSRKELNKDYRCKNILSLTLKGVVNNDPENPIGLVPKDYSDYQIFERDDLVFKLIDLENYKTSRVGLVYEKGIMSSAYIRLQKKETSNIKYFYYQYYDLYLRGVYNKLGEGVRSTLNAKDLLNIRVVKPPIDEQDQIARFLDNKLFKINKFIKAKKRQIVLLKELKQAIINQAVTKGINLNVPMKDSGVEWIGEIPEHWDVRKLSNIAVIILSGLDKKSYDGQRQVKLCNYIDVYSNHYITNDINFMTATAKENEIMKFSLFKGDIIITKDSESWDDIAVPAYVSEDLENVLCGYHLAIIRVNTLDVYKQFLFKSFLSNYVAYQFNIKAKGVTRYGISYQHIHDTMIVIPPFREQKEIVSFIINQTQTIDKAIETIQKQIDLVKEYRTTLISEVVTGKVDVRHIPVEDTDEFIEDIDGEDEGIFVEKFTEEV